MEFRQAVASDAEALFALNEAFNGEGCNTVERIGVRLQEASGEIVIVAQEGEALVGFCCAQVLRSICYARPFAQLTELYTAPAHRRRGAARGMIARAEQLLAQLGVREVFLLTGLDNDEARPAYEACAYGGDEVMMYQKALSPEAGGSAE